MITYVLKNSVIDKQEVDTVNLLSSKNTVTVLTKEDESNLVDVCEVKHSDYPYNCLGLDPSILTCFEDYTYGNLSYVELSEDREHLLTHNITFYMTKDALALVLDARGEFFNWFVKRLESGFLITELKPQPLIISLVNLQIEHNECILKLCENMLEDLEEAVLLEIKKEYSRSIVSKRKLVMELRRELTYLVYTIDMLSANLSKLFTANELRLLIVLEHRASKCADCASVLRDYATQVREAYEAEQDLATNSLMKVFTIMTSICMPLGILVGWYGMNFENMPELANGYQYFVAVFIGVVLSAFAFFKRKKWL